MLYLRHDKAMIRRHASNGRGSDIYVPTNAPIRQAYMSETPSLSTVGDGTPAPGFWFYVPTDEPIRQAYMSETPSLSTVGDGTPAPGFWVQAWVYVPTNADER